MNVSVLIPDDLVRRIGAGGESIERRVLEALALDEFRLGRLTRPDLKRLLGFATRGELDAFLADRGFVGDFGESDLERDRAYLQRLDL